MWVVGQGRRMTGKQVSAFLRMYSIGIADDKLRYLLVLEYVAEHDMRRDSAVKLTATLHKEDVALVDAT
ncbi:hypothetical protein C8Q80DRAFT_1134644 [Daedaleopsis nitida]|nr:hypothetical protein C8Q80DRAFT_1134644 [Daedaleopsis nitida]